MNKEDFLSDYLAPATVVCLCFDGLLELTDGIGFDSLMPLAAALVICFLKASVKK